MRVGHLNVTRPAYYDRAATATGRSYGAGGVAPHGVTTRWTYTVPTGSAAYIEYVQTGILRDGASGAPGFSQALVQFNTGSNNPLIGNSWLQDGTAGARQLQGVGSAGYMQAGQDIQGRTGDTSVGGTCRYQVDAKLVEFVA